MTKMHIKENILISKPKIVSIPSNKNIQKSYID